MTGRSPSGSKPEPVQSYAMPDMNADPHPAASADDDDLDDGSDPYARRTLDRAQLSRMTRHMGPVIGAGEWTAVLGDGEDASKGKPGTGAAG